MNSKRIKKLGLPFAVMLLGGCTVVPGSNMPYSTNGGSWFSKPKDDTQTPADLTEQVNIYPITPGLLVKLNKKQPTGEAVLNQSLNHQISQYDYVVGNGDVLNITVWDHPELTIPQGSYRSAADAGNWVHNDGTIFYPYVGKIKVAGLKVTEIRDILRQRLTKYIENPQVDVTVAAFRSKRVYVSGEVKKPGVQPITNVPLTLLEAVNRAGGLASDADWTNVTLTRDGKEQHFSLKALYQDGNTDQNILLKPDDIVHVARNDGAKVFVLGEVGEPKSYTIGRDGMTLAEALSDAGGFNETTANASGIFVMRQAPQGSGKVADVYQLDAKNATALVMADQFKLKARDLVYVTAAPVVRWNRIISQLLPTSTMIYNGIRSRQIIDNE